MKQKELKNLANKIAKNELIIQNSKDKEEVKRAQDEIVRLSRHVHGLDDLEIIDEMIMEILNKNS